MSNSNYSIGLLRLKPVHTAYDAICMSIRKLSWVRDVNGRDRDETDTLTIFLETRQRRDVGTSWDRDLETKTTTLQIIKLNIVCLIIELQRYVNHLYCH